MYSVLLQEESDQTAADDSPFIEVPVTVLVTGSESSQVSFEAKEAVNYTVEAQSILLVGSGGSPRQYLVTFTLAPESQEAKYTFADPALKFFQGNSKNAGFRVSPNPDLVSATVSLFNTKKSGDPETRDEFSLIFINPATGLPFAHDPTIIWDPPHS